MAWFKSFLRGTHRPGGARFVMTSDIRMADGGCYRRITDTRLVPRPLSPAPYATCLAWYKSVNSMPARAVCDSLDIHHAWSNPWSTPQSHSCRRGDGPSPRRSGWYVDGNPAHQNPSSHTAQPLELASTTPCMGTISFRCQTSRRCPRTCLQSLTLVCAHSVTGLDCRISVDGSR